MSEKIKFLVMLQARCGSTRLPNKVLKDLCGKPSLQQEIERIQRSKYIDEVMVVTSINKNNIPIIKLCGNMGIRVGVGSEDDVLDRYYQTARLIKPEYVIRLTADCPCFDSRLVDDAIDKMPLNIDYCAPISETLADGLDFEIISYTALEKAWNEANLSSEREHVTPYIKKHSEIFSLWDYVSPIGNFGNHRWTIDEEEDYIVVSEIYKHFKNNDFGYEDIIDFLENNKKIMNLNSKYKRNEGYKKSLSVDKTIK